MKFTEVEYPHAYGTSNFHKSTAYTTNNIIVILCLPTLLFTCYKIYMLRVKSVDNLIIKLCVYNTFLE